MSTYTVYGLFSRDLNQNHGYYTFSAAKSCLSRTYIARDLSYSLTTWAVIKDITLCSSTTISSANHSPKSIPQHVLTDRENQHVQNPSIRTRTTTTIISSLLCINPRGPPFYTPSPVPPPIPPNLPLLLLLLNHQPPSPYKCHHLASRSEPSRPPQPTTLQRRTHPPPTTSARDLPPLRLRIWLRPRRGHRPGVHVPRRGSAGGGAGERRVGGAGGGGVEEGV